MNDKVTISEYQLAKLIPNAEAARLYLESRIWRNGVTCPACKEVERITTRRGGFYRCNACKLDFSIRTGTIFQRSHIPLDKWLLAMYKLVTARKGISSVQLSKEIGVTQKSAWFLLHRLREACGNDLAKLQGIVEVDETYIGGKEKNKHVSKRFNLGGGNFGKIPVVGMRERGGRAVAKVMKIDAKFPDFRVAVKDHVAEGSTLHTDDSVAYPRLAREGYNHESVCHSKEEYVRGEVTTNSIESFWAVLKRGLHGVYHHADKKHLARYVNEFAFRLNDANVKRHTLERLDSFVDATVGRHITYKELTA